MEKRINVVFPTDKESWLKWFDRIHEGTAIEHLGIKLEKIDEMGIELTMPITPKTLQPYGLLHGGITMALAETAASVHASWGKDLTKEAPVGIEISGSHIRSASEGVVRAVGKVIRRTRSLIFHQIDVYHEDSGNLLSTIRATNFYKPINKEAA